jgi:hypothetical protein
MNKPTRFAVQLSVIALCVFGNVSGYPQREKFNPDGSFWIIGEPPAAFKDFGGINLNASRNARMNKPGVNLTDGRWLKFRTLTVNRNNLVFTTMAVRGTSYSFKGKFLRGGTFAAHDLEDKAVLEGTLTKMVGGKVVAEAPLKFSYFGGT